MIPLTTDQYDWGFVSGRVSALEGRLLGRDYLVGLLGQRDSRDLFRQLQETALSTVLTPGAPWDDCSGIIDRYFYGQLDSLREDSPDPRVFDLFLGASDFLNLKRALLGGTDFRYPAGELRYEDLTRVAQGDLTALPPALRTEAEALQGDLSEEERRALIDVVLDGAYLRRQRARALALDVPLITEYVEMSILAQALVALYRAYRSGQELRRYRQHFLPLEPWTDTLDRLTVAGDPAAWGDIVGGDMGALLKEAAERPEDEQASYFERRAAERGARIAERGRAQTFGPERVFAFLVALATEAYNLKVVVCGRMGRIDADLLRQRMRECYG